MDRYDIAIYGMNPSPRYGHLVRNCSCWSGESKGKCWNNFDGLCIRFSDHLKPIFPLMRIVENMGRKRAAVPILGNTKSFI